jgi:glycogen debranching enzyme
MFAALWARVATPRQAAALVRGQLENPRRFGAKYPIPGLARSEPGYVEGRGPGDKPRCLGSWRAHTWIPVNYFTIHGLRAYGYAREARELAEKTWALFRGYPFHEYYCSENGLGTGRHPFKGWSSLAMFVLAEQAMGLDPTRLGPRNLALSRMAAWVASQSYRS